MVRDGTRFITGTQVNRVNLNYIVDRLNLCSNRHDNCVNCPEETVCTKAYDVRCSLNETICPECHQEVPFLKYCPECGTKFEKKKKEVKDNG